MTKKQEIELFKNPMNGDTTWRMWTWVVSENMIISGIVVKDLDGQTWMCVSFEVIWHDNTAPELSSEFTGIEINECTTWEIKVEAIDSGCADSDIQYRFGWVYGANSWQDSWYLQIPATWIAQTWNQTLKVKDSLNESEIMTGMDYNTDKSCVFTRTLEDFLFNFEKLDENGTKEDNWYIARV